MCHQLFVCTQLNESAYDLQVNSLYVISLLNDLEVIFLHSSIAIVSTQLRVFNYCYLPQIILFNINHLFAYSEVAI